MKIAIDCRYIGKSGIGRALEGILDNLDFTNDEFTLIGEPQKLKKYKPAFIFEDYTDPYSKSGIFTNWKKINKQCDALFIPNFLIPFSVRVPTYSIIHDLIFLDMKKTTTKNEIDYLIKKALLKRCVKHSKHIFCVSRFTLERCYHYYPKYKSKFSLNYSAVSKAILNFSTESIKKENKIVFVGNVKPHKGIMTLLNAFEEIGNGDLKLKIIGEKDNFITGLKVDESKFKNVEFTGKLTDQKLYREIASAKYLVLPSKYEGFGLPPLEALCLGTQPIVSDIPVFKEVYHDLPVKFFVDENGLKKEMLEEPQNISKEQEKIISKKYSFCRMAKCILTKIDPNGKTLH